MVEHCFNFLSLPSHLTQRRATDYRRLCKEMSPRRDRQPAVCARTTVQTREGLPSFDGKELVQYRREKDVPEIGRRRGEFDGHKRAFRTELRRTGHVSVDLFLGCRIFECNFGALLEGFRENDERAGGTDGVCGSFDRLLLASDRDANRNL